MNMSGKIATVFGGTGFIGRYVVKELAALGMTVKIGTRRPESAYFLQPCGRVGQIVPLFCDYGDDNSLASLIRDSDYVVNCVGILHETRKGGFNEIHARLPGRMAQAARDMGVSRFVHISALGADKSKARYARSKREGEEAVMKAFPAATILRPSVVFGPEDQFFNKFAALARFLPALPLIGGGKTRFQPVYVGDVADAVVRALTLSVTGAQNPCGRTYEVGGAEVLTFRQIYEKLFAATGRRRLLMPTPWSVAKIQAIALNMLPHPPLTPDQVELLKTDNVVAAEAAKLADLGIEPAGLGLILSGYMEPYRRGGRFADKKRA